jgi:hypothetical protein
MGVMRSIILLSRMSLMNLHDRTVSLRTLDFIISIPCRIAKPPRLNNPRAAYIRLYVSGAVTAASLVLLGTFPLQI